MKYYEVIATYNISGKEYECLATHDNKQAIFLNEEQANARVMELTANGYNARVQVNTEENAWYSDKNWIG